ncbi:MAG: selenide, water dikinase SelD [Synechococcales bacterium]|nr:selenide, water dikinase SelD [Synechococcales bacterium]
MKSPNPEITQDLVLVGGGHSHAIALKKWGMNPIPGVRLTLVTDVYHTPYSGMLPGYVAGLYTFDQCHIDLRPLSRFAGARLVCDRAIHIDLTKNQLHCAHHPPIGFDLLSLDIGSTPSTVTVPGAQEYAIPVKPISQYLNYWEQVVADVTQAPQRPFRLGVVGGGAGGVELALSAQARLQRLYRQTDQLADHLEIHLFHRGAEILPERHPRLRDLMSRLMACRGIHLHLGETVAAIEPMANGAELTQETGDEAYWVRCESGLTVGCDRVFWVTQASAAPWLAQSGLDTDDRGFVTVNDCLQSTSHPQVFAAGDVATMVNHPRPKAGVFAVRQGEPLYRNLRRAVLDQPLRPFRPQKKFLILIGTGNETAVASRGAFNLGPHSLLWQWKDRIDRQFMDRFTHLDQAMPTTNPRSHPPISPPHPMPCAGCGSKVGSSVLERVLTQIRADYPDGGDRPDILIGLGEPDDAAVIQVPDQRYWVQTVDYFRALLDDPFLLGQITANHCLSDLFAMGADPHSVMAIATLPRATSAKQEETLYHLLSGVVKVTYPTAPLIGGHTVSGDELALGLVCNGTVAPDQILRKGGMNPGDRLLLTKALGTGTLFAADMQLRAKGRWIEGAIQSMLLSNQAAAHCLRAHQATACTDVTGFGLLGHLLEMMRSPHTHNSLAVELHLATLPLLEGAMETITAGWLSSLHPENLKAAQAIANYAQMAEHPLLPILTDPQTSGGLIATVPADLAPDCLQALHHLGYGDSAIIGTVVATGGESLPVLLR